jgi:hypothetical protein
MAVLSSGLRVKVPMFVNKGDKISVHTKVSARAVAAPTVRR